MSEIRCTNCELYKDSTAGSCSAVKIDGCGSKNAGIMLVGDFPGIDEVRTKKPFTGQSGQLLRNYASSVGISEDTAFFTNVIRCKPKAGIKIKPSEIKACLPHLQEEIERISPKVICALGSTACKALGLSGKITGTHGAKTWSEEYGCWILPLYHPSYVARFTNQAPQRLDFVSELGLAKKLVGQEESIEKVQYKVARSLEDIEKAADYLVKQEWFSFDIETTNHDFLRSKIPCIQFSAKERTAIIIPWEHPEIFPEIEDQERVKEQIQRIMLSPAKKCAQYGKYDLTHLFGHGIEVKGYAFDTMLAHYLLDENGLHNLGLLLRTYTDMKDYKDMMAPYFKKTLENGDNAILEADTDLLFEYGGKDADGTFRLIRVFHDLLVEEGLDKLFYKVVMPLAYVLAKMEFTGITVDKEYVENTANLFSGKMKALNCSLQKDRHVQKYIDKIYEKEMEEWRKKVATKTTRQKTPKEPERKEFNFSSPKQLKELLYDQMGIKVIKRNAPTKTNKEGSASTDAATLADLAKITKHKVLEDLLN